MYLALHEPYVLAFEPSFVEIRHIETGLMSQVIQGSNLRLLFADTPPSVTNAGTPPNHSPYQTGFDHRNPYMGSPGSTGSIHGSVHGGYGGQSPHAPSPYSNSFVPRNNPQGTGRDEILIVSEDRVLALRTAAGPQRPMSDAASTMSIPR